jgi:hypothetical protein
MINEKPFTFSVIPGTGLDEVDLAMAEFQAQFKKMKEDALEKERLAKEAADAAPVESVEAEIVQ